jgi:DNA primase
MPSLVKKKKTKVDVSLPEFISGYVTLKKVGKNYKGLCPFHKEKTPSFMVDEKRFHCFGCGLSGDATDFLSEWDARK